MFSYITSVRIHEADAAGVLFFGRYFTLAHNAYEAFLEKKGFSTSRIFRQESFLIPVVHAEADYKAPLWVGDSVTIHLYVTELRRRSFTLKFHFLNSEGKVVCVIQTTHVIVDKDKKRAVPLPEKLHEVLKQELSETAAQEEI